jgi:hypothetical protein
MYRFLIFLLSLAVLAMPAGSWAASTSSNLAINVTPGQAVTGISLSDNTFPGGAPSGTVVGAISVTMSPATPAFTGSLSLSGANASQFQISGSNLVTNGTVPAGTYNINIVATEAGVSGSPFTQAATVTGTSPQPAGFQTPGPSLALFNSPYYTCNQNWYVATTGSDTTGNGTSGNPWATLQKAHNSISISGQGSWCVNVQPGTYSVGVNITRGGNLASSTGYVVWRCTTMDACTITGPGSNQNGAFSWATKTSAGAYAIIDGFTLIGGGPNGNAFGQGVQIWDGGGTCAGGADCDYSTHHIWVLNSIVHEWGQSGLQMNDGEYFYAAHNTLYNNSISGCGARGSGISVGFLKAFAGYTPVADDANANNNAALNMMGVQGPAFPYRNSFTWNVLYNNRLNTSCGNNSDGNNIIADSWSNYWNTYGSYTGGALFAFNVVYNSGGIGIQMTDSAHATIANNSCYNNNLYTLFTATYRPCIGSNGIGPNVILNNIAYSIKGSGPLAYSSSFSSGNGGSGPNPGNSYSNNMSYCANNGGRDCVAMYNGDVFSCTGNKCETLPGWVNVGNSSAGSMTTQPVGANFALQPGSPAIGYGLTKPYLPAQSVDAGACYHSLTSCP